MTEALTIAIAGVVIGSFYGIVGLGISFVFRVTKMLNLAHGGLVMFTGLGYATAVRSGLSAVPAALLTIALGVALGLVQGYGMRPWLNDAKHLVGVFMTLALGLLLEGVALLAFGRDSLAAPPVVSLRAIHIHGAVITGPQQVLVAAVIICSLLFAIWFYKSHMGRVYRAIVDDELGAKSLGLSVNQFRSIAFGVGGLAAAVAAIATTPPTSIVYSAGPLILVNGLTASVLGGLANPLGALVGGILVGLVQSITVGEVSAVLELPVSLALLLVVLVARPEGLFPAKVKARAV